MGLEKRKIEEDETPTHNKLRAIMRAVTTGNIEFETVLPQAIITLLVVGGVVYMFAAGMPVPDTLNNALFIIIGFYFGSDYQFRRGKKSGA
jgi:hypothetical protein